MSEHSLETTDIGPAAAVPATGPDSTLSVSFYISAGLSLLCAMLLGALDQGDSFGRAWTGLQLMLLSLFLALMLGVTLAGARSTWLAIASPLVAIMTAIANGFAVVQQEHGLVWTGGCTVILSCSALALYWIDRRASGVLRWAIIPLLLIFVLAALAPLNKAEFEQVVDAGISASGNAGR